MQFVSLLLKCKHAKDAYAIKNSYQKKEYTKFIAQKNVATFKGKKTGREEIKNNISQVSEKEKEISILLMKAIPKS